MNKFRFTLTALAIMAFTLMVSSAAQAQATRTWVSGVGDDVNPCSRTAPCKTFAGAISKTATGGEISVLDPGGFGAVTITKAITINGEGTLAGILSAGTVGIIINAPVTADVAIRNVSIHGAGTGTDGIRVLAARTVNIENVTITNVINEGIDVAATNNVNLSVANSYIRNCTLAGIQIATTNGLAKATLDHVTVTNSATGIKARSNARVSMSECNVAFNTTGVHAEAQTGGALAVVNLEHCLVTQNAGNGLQAGGGISAAGSFIRMSDNQITNNIANGISIQVNGTVETFMNNEITGNGTNGCPGCANISASFN